MASNGFDLRLFGGLEIPLSVTSDFKLVDNRDKSRDVGKQHIATENEKCLSPDTKPERLSRQSKRSGHISRRLNAATTAGRWRISTGRVERKRCACYTTEQEVSRLIDAARAVAEKHR
jgi:hypothetical protein